MSPFMYFFCIFRTQQHFASTQGVELSLYISHYIRDTDFQQRVFRECWGEETKRGRGNCTERKQKWTKQIWLLNLELTALQQRMNSKYTHSLVCAHMHTHTYTYTNTQNFFHPTNPFPSDKEKWECTLHSHHRRDPQWASNKPSDMDKMSREGLEDVRLLVASAIL